MLRVNSQKATLICVGVVLTAGFFLTQTGCKPSAEKQAMLEQRLNQEIDNLFASIQDLQAKGQLTEALALTETGLKNNRYAPQKARFFGQKIDLLLALDKDAAAADFVIAAWKTEPALAKSVFGKLYNYYLLKNSLAAALTWCKRLLDLGSALPADLRNQVLGWRLNSCLTMADQNAAKESIDDIVRLMKAEEGSPLLLQALGGLIDAGQHALAAAMISHISTKNPDEPAYQQLVAVLNIRHVLATGNWTQYPEALKACVAKLPDDQLLKLTRQIFGTLQKNNRKDLVEKSSETIIFSATAKTNSVNLASRLWVESGIANDKKLLPERLDALLRAKVSPVQVGNLFDRYFYEMVNDLDIIRSLCSLGERILTICNDETTVNNLKVKILDGAFIVENFDLAVQMLEQGIPGKDKLWHDMSLPKVKAHRALAQKNPREAVKYFREFMNCWINSKQEEEYDPTSGIAYSREWILGRNANRIANILDSIPDKAEADKAREEAKAYFRIAVKKAAADAEATKLIKEETKSMGL